MKSNKQLDEMQESKLLKIQEKGFWLVFWVLFAAIFVQALIGMTLKEIAGEIVVLVAASIYIAAASLKKYTANNKEQFSYKYYSCTDSWSVLDNTLHCYIG